MKIEDFINTADEFGLKRIPFFFLLDFELKKPILCRIEDANKLGILFVIGAKKNFHSSLKNSPSNISQKIFPIQFKNYNEAFEKVIDNLEAGNTYLLNLTYPTKMDINLNMDEIFQSANAQYKLYYKKEFVVFSPECFVRTRDNFIYSYPMKGTIDADIPNAESVILNDKKEEWEHNTIVDLIRNDLSMVSKNISVTKFRFISHLKTNMKDLLQVSSEIKGNLPMNWEHEIGELLLKMLPAGSISGAPKQKTVEIIKDVEKIDRGYFTGIFGIFDGKNIDSAVNIRYIEKTDDGLQFRSGGGITAMSNAESEYNEMIDKVYVPSF